MSTLKVILTIIFVIVCIALSVIILLQEGKQSGLGAISGAADTYWGKNKGRSMEGKLEQGTKILVVAFFVFAILLNINSIANPDKESSSSGTSNVVTQSAGTVNQTEDNTDETQTDETQTDDAQNSSEDAAE